MILYNCGLVCLVPLVTVRPPFRRSPSHGSRLAALAGSRESGCESRLIRLPVWLEPCRRRSAAAAAHLCAKLIETHRRKHRSAFADHRERHLHCRAAGFAPALDVSVVLSLKLGDGLAHRSGGVQSSLWPISFASRSMSAPVGSSIRRYLSGPVCRHTSAKSATAFRLGRHGWRRVILAGMGGSIHERASVLHFACNPLILHWWSFAAFTVKPLITLTKD